MRALGVSAHEQSILHGMPPFWLSIAVLSLVQGALVAVPGALSDPRLARLRGRRWAVIPPLSVIGFVLVARAAEDASAQGLTYLALGAVPLLAALTLGRLAYAGRPPWALLVVPLFALAWADRGGLAGEGAALALSALSCAALGVLLAAVTPPRWLAAGIVAMAAADTTLVVAELLQRPNNALNAARPAAGLPQLQSAVFGTAVMGYGDLFVAGALGGLLALTIPRASQRGAAVVVAGLALGFDLLFFFVHELPATVPVALTLLIFLAVRWRAARAPAQGEVSALSARAGARSPGAQAPSAALGPPAEARASSVSVSSVARARARASR
jgi:hypothetical protein